MGKFLGPGILDLAMRVRYKCVDRIENNGRAVGAGFGRAAGEDAPVGRPSTFAFTRRGPARQRGPRMATGHGLLRSALSRAASAGGVALALGLALNIAGCASSKRQEPPPLMVAALPAPNFDGPDLAEPAP